MIEQKHVDRIAYALPFLQQPGSQLALDFQRAAYLARLSAGREIFAMGDRVDGIALLISGMVRVYKIGESGREITLYRFGQGESCIITANAILNSLAFPAIAVVEQDAEALMIPSGDFSDWVNRYEAWRQFVFKLNAQRLASVIEVVDQVAFQRMDRRIAALLLERAGSGSTVRATHQAIANELGSSREVISRLLEDFSGRGIVRLSRGEIELLDRQKLFQQLAV
jgi:CRP/FNR family transcriptional regulator